MGLPIAHFKGFLKPLFDGGFGGQNLIFFMSIHLFTISALMLMILQRVVTQNAERVNPVRNPLESETKRKMMRLMMIRVTAVVAVFQTHTLWSLHKSATDFTT